MGVYGKQQNAPGYQKVAAERQRWREVKEKHLTYNWFVEELDEWLKSHEEYLRVNEPWMYRFNCVWCDKVKKNIYVKKTHEELLYWRLRCVGNGIEDIDHCDVIQIPSWSLESRLALEDIMCEKKKMLVYEIYKEEKEQDNMENEDERTQKTKVRFS